MRQTSGESPTFNETTGLGSIFIPGNDFPCTIAYLDCKISANYRKEINLEDGINGNDGVMPDSRPVLSDEQFNERNPLSNWTQCVAKVQKFKLALVFLNR